MRKLLILVCFIIELLIFTIEQSFDNDFFVGISLVVILIATIVFYSFWIKSKKSLFSITPMFILGFFIVFFQITILDFLGYKIISQYEYFIWADVSIKKLSLSLSSLGLISYYVGYVFSKEERISFKHQNIHKTQSISIYIIVFTYVFYLAFLSQSGSYILGEYTPDDASSYSSYMYKLFKVTLSASVLINVSNITGLNCEIKTFKEYLSYFNKPILYLLLWYLLFSLLIGDRGPVLYFSILAFSAYFIRFKKITKLKFGLFLVFGSLFMSIVGIVRQSRESGIVYSERVVNVISSLGLDKENRMFGESIPGEGSIELAKSIRTFNHAIYNVPDNYNFSYGYFQLRNLISVVPGASGMLLKLVHDGDPMYNGSSNFVTYLIQGNSPSYGDGSAILVDFYLDFGIFGVFLGMFCFGVFVRKNEYKIHSGFQKPTFTWIAIMIYFSLSIYINRSSLLLEFGNICLIYLVIKFNKLNNKKLS